MSFLCEVSGTRIGTADPSLLRGPHRRMYREWIHTLRNDACVQGLTLISPAQTGSWRAERAWESHVWCGTVSRNVVQGTFSTALKRQEAWRPAVYWVFPVKTRSPRTPWGPPPQILPRTCTFIWLRLHFSDPDWGWGREHALLHPACLSLKSKLQAQPDADRRSAERARNQAPQP